MWRHYRHLSTLTLLYFVTCFLSTCNAKTYECINSNTPSTRTFNSINDYQSNRMEFDPHRNYVEFNISKIPILETNVFITYDSNHIAKIILNGKTIEVVDSGAFNELFCCRCLVLTNNSISRLENGTFLGLSTVEEIYLDQNLIRIIPAGAFSNLTHLHKLDLSRNELSRLSENSFQTLTNLLELRLDRNELTQLPSGLFKVTKHLRRLSLGWNKMSNIETLDFNNLILLTELDLSSNQLSDLNPSKLELMTDLKDLNLSGNRLIHFDPNSLPTLKRIWIENNLFQCSELQIILNNLQIKGIGVVIHNKTVYENVDISDVGCYNDTIPVTPSTPSVTTTVTTTTVTPSSGGGKNQNDRMILTAVSDLKTVVLILIILIVIFNVIDIMIRTNACARLRARQNNAFSLSNADADLPLLIR